MRWLASCFLVLVALSVHASEGFQFRAEYGPHLVGFRVVQQYDLSRSYRVGYDAVTGEADQGLQGRPIQTLIWYPAASPGRPLIYDDYLRLAATEDRFDLDKDEAMRITTQALREYLAFGVSPTHIDAVRNEPVRATGDAPAEQGAFPLIIYAPSDASTAFENDGLCEYLASHGYVVIASPSHGAHVRYMRDGSVADSVENTRAQAADIGFLIGYAGSLPDVDGAKVGVVGYSWGGMASTFAAVADSRIRALVDLDGSVRYFPNVLAAAPDVIPDRITVPLLFFAERGDPLGPGVDSLPNSFLAHIHYADVTEIGLHRLSHDDLATDNLRFLSEASSKGTTVDERNESYAWVARYTLAFLDATLKRDAGAKLFMAATPDSEHVPAGVLSIRHRASAGVPPSVQDFARTLRARGFDNALQVYAAYTKEHPGFHIPDDTFEAWFSSLSDLAHADDAVDICLLWSHVSPKSIDAWTDLGAAYEIAGKPEKAVSSYRKILAIDPHNRIAMERIKSLTSVLKG
ncbi:dienelactone hydrolase family protein [Dyella halodurans]|uniref:Dienelactone hydrolase family protein n=1 Tax=Dyella halodurans TaxID=1920171 RepID=A0ABV9C0I7_9GAMM|nr:dienelactone hydrolase family protein [Dyella halodurans]